MQERQRVSWTRRLGGLKVKFPGVTVRNQRGNPSALFVIRPGCRQVGSDLFLITNA